MGSRRGYAGWPRKGRSRSSAPRRDPIPMIILGISHDVLICSAAVVVDGNVTSAIAEERLDRRKMSRVFPALAVKRCLQESNLTLEDIDEIAIAWNPFIDLETIPGGYLEARRWRTEHLSQLPARIMQLMG